MKNYSFFCGMVTLLAFTYSFSKADEEAPQKQEISIVVVGRVLNPFQAIDAFGQLRQSDQLKGKRGLLVTFFPKCFTGNCTSQLVSLSEHYVELQKQGIEVWAVSTDSPDGPQGQRAFSEHLKLPFPLLPDPDRKISFLFGAVQSKQQMAARQSVFIDKNGVVCWIDKQINPRNHGADVLARLQAESNPAPPATK